MKQRYLNTAHICFIVIGLVLFAGGIGAAQPLDALLVIFVLGVVGGSAKGYASYL